MGNYLKKKNIRERPSSTSVLHFQFQMCVKQVTTDHNAPRNVTASTMPHVTNLPGSVRVRSVHLATVFTKVRLLVKVSKFKKTFSFIRGYIQYQSFDQY